jgi:hypothetical protein
VVWAAALSLFVCVTFSGEVETSPDGLTWTSRTAAAANAWQGLVWAPELGGGLLVAVAGSGTNRVMTSPDGINWTSRSAASALNWWGVSWSASLGLLVAVAAQSGTTSAMSSPDGTTWTSRTPSDTGNAWFSVTWSPTVGKFVAVGSTGGIMYSSNGTSWTSIADRAGATNALTSVLWVPEESRYIAVLYLTTRIFTSTDAITWVEEIIPSGEWGLNGPTSMAYGDGTVIGVADDNSTNPIIFANISDHFDQLTGIPASGPGSVTMAIPRGDLVNVWVQRDDTTAQTALIALDLAQGLVSDGVIEHLISDERRNEASLTALCDADLALFSSPLVTVTYATRDVKTKSGKPIVFNLASPLIAETLTIQDVTIDQIDIAPNLAPRFTVTASNVRFSLEDMLRQLLTKVAA